MMVKKELYYTLLSVLLLLYILGMREKRYLPTCYICNAKYMHGFDISHQASKFYSI